MASARAGSCALHSSLEHYMETNHEDVVWELLSFADHAVADAMLATLEEFNLGPKWRVKFQPDAPDSLYELTTIDEEIGWLHYFDASGLVL
jgi:hypothetical protein